jgi:hypothetical protein
MKRRGNMDNFVNWFGFNRAADKDGGSCPLERVE